MAAPEPPPLSEADFLSRLGELLAAPVDGIDAARRAAIFERAAARIRDGGAPGCRVVPYAPGCRPTDEAGHPGLGSSDQVAMLLAGSPWADMHNRAYLLYELPGARDPQLKLDVTLSLGDGALEGWDRRPIDPMVLTEGGALRPAEAGDAVFALELDPDRDLRVDGAYGFADQFLRGLRVDLRVCDGGTPLCAGTAALNVCAVSRLGSLYQRVIERVVAPDAARQAAAAGHADPGPAYHPWFPVLCIGSEKAALYTDALVEDIVGKERHLSDPCWLLRVGIWLELLTCLGIAEAVRPELGDILEPAEREAFETLPGYEEVRRRIDPVAWKRVWELRQIAFPRVGTPRAGPVSALNLLAKKRTTLAFLHVHHDDLKHAIELAGANSHNAQETWHRVFRDAERAVLRKTAEAFPELGFLPDAAREFVLWHRMGFGVRGKLRVPAAIARLLTDQDGLFASACVQYRESMNDVADWAKARGLMDHTGEECVPAAVSLFEAHEHDPPRVDVLQKRDGYRGGLEVVEAGPAERPPLADAEALLREVPILAVLAPEQITELARRSRPLALGPAERFIVQGEEGTSLFVIADGEIEVVVRQPGGEDVTVDTMARGAVLGEMALLTGDPRAATARARDGALVYEVGRAHFDELLRQNPQWIDQLAEIMSERLRERAAFLAQRVQQPERPAQLAARIRRRLQAQPRLAGAR